MREKFEPVVIENLYPELDFGRHPVKREVEDTLEVRADIFADGHGEISAALKRRQVGESDWTETPMRHLGNDRWAASIPLTENARYEYTIEAWRDEFGSWRDEVQKKIQAGQRVEVELIEGRKLVEETAKKSNDASLKTVLTQFDDASYEESLALLLSGDAKNLMDRHADRSNSTVYPVREVFVDRVEARYGAWYEMFHRSQGTVVGRGATFAECEERLPEIKDMGFDVVYLLPIHPIGKSFRKGPNNTLNAGPEDPGSPYAIGSEDGGHKSINPELGTLEDFERFVAACRGFGMEVALDIAIQCSPDHPYITEHPDWFKWRPDGSIKYAENPPKKYQDIVNVDFYCDDWENLWREWRDVFLFWVERGVRIFRVDNPHTKPFDFWEWCIKEIQAEYPDVIFLSEAFTRPKVMKKLAKLGFAQSYTYFTWRHTKWEFTEYLTELTRDEPREYMRPNFFTNTHDINPWVLQDGGRAAFQMRFVLASTLSSVYGIYNGFELCESTPVPGREEFLNSEKYEYKVWDWDRPGNIKEYIKRVNQIRRENPALHEFTNLTFHEAQDENILFYGKKSGEGENTNAVFIAVNFDPHNAHDAHVRFPLWELGIGEDEDYVVEEQLTGREIPARGSWFWVRLAPQENIAEIFKVRRARV